MKIVKKLGLILLIVPVFIYLFLYYCEVTNKCKFGGSLPLTSCSRYMGPVGVEGKMGGYATKKSVLENCDNRTFVELDHEYAKDKNNVYYRPMPNANFMTVILEEADPETFQILEKCSPLAIDKNNVYELGKVSKEENLNTVRGWDGCF